MTAALAEELEQHRQPLVRLAYRMLGELAEAEDVVQDAYLRWREVDRSAVESAKAYLSAVVTRLCLDRLKAARRRRELYVGAWLPEPLVEEYSPAASVAASDDVSFALMLALERLSPLERAAFLLHDVFDVGFEEIAAILGRSAVACRQLASRARTALREARPRFPVAPEEGRRFSEAFFTASRDGDTERLRQLLAESATFHSDGGGRKYAALRPITGAAKVCRMYAGLARKARGAPPWRQHALINGLPGTITVEPDGTLQATALEIADGRIHAIYVMRNPDKLAHVLARLPPAVRAMVTTASSTSERHRSWPLRAAHRACRHADVRLPRSK